MLYYRQYGIIRQYIKETINMQQYNLHKLILQQPIGEFNCVEEISYTYNSALDIWEIRDQVIIPLLISMGYTPKTVELLFNEDLS